MLNPESQERVNQLVGQKVELFRQKFHRINKLSDPEVVSEPLTTRDLWELTEVWTFVQAGVGLIIIAAASAPKVLERFFA